MSAKVLQPKQSIISRLAEARPRVFLAARSLVNHSFPHLIHNSVTVFPQARSVGSKGLNFFDGTQFILYNPPAHQVLTISKTMPTRTQRKVVDNLLLFPMEDDAIEFRVSDTRVSTEPQSRPEVFRSHAIGGIDELDVVLCGTYRKDVEGLRRSFEQLKDLGFNVLSPSSVDIASEVNGFVYMHGEQTETPEHLELRHL